MIMGKKISEAISDITKFNGSDLMIDVITKWLDEDDINLSEISSNVSVQEWVKFAVLADEKKEKTGRVIRKVKDYVYENYGKNISLEEIAKMVYFNQAYLGRLFKKETGESFNDFLLSVRMEKAKELLKDPRYKVYEIGNCIGYKTTQYFYKVFKAYYGVTPTEYRKKILLL